MSSGGPEVSARRLKWARRRNVGGAVAVFAFGALAYQAAQSSWYVLALVTDSGAEVTYLSPQQLATGQVLPSPAGMVPALYTVFGMNAPAAWMITAVLLGALATITRLGVLALFGMGAAWMGRSAVVALDANLTTGLEPGQIAPVGNGAALYVMWCWLLVTALAVSAVRITYAGHVRRRAAVDSGEELPVNLLDTFHAAQASAFNRMAAPAKQSGAKQTTG